MTSTRASNVGSGPGSRAATSERAGGRKTGRPKPRPIEIAAQPVSTNIRAASAIERMSPLPMIGRRSTASNQGANAVEIYQAAKTLSACSPMQDHRRHADLFKRSSQVGSGQIVGVPAETHLHRDRNVNRIDHRRDQIRRRNRVAASAPNRRRS